MTTKSKAGAGVRFLGTRVVVGGITVAGFLGLWGVIAAQASSGAGQGPAGEASESGVRVPAGNAGEVVIIERQVVYYIVSPGASAAAGSPSLPPASIPQVPAPVEVRAPSSVSAAPPAPRKVATSSSKKSKGS